MKILLIHRYFWPDTPPYAIILKKIAARLADDGHDVEVLSTQPAYKPDANIAPQKTIETINGYKIRRLGFISERGGKSIIKAFNMLFFGLRVVLHTLRHRQYDVVMISTSPPIIAGLAGRISAKLSNAKFLYHCMDIHPEIGKISGEFSNKKLFRFLQKIDSKTCRHAARIIVLSDDMKKAILERGNNDSCRIDVIQNFNLDDNANDTVALDDKFAKPKGVFRLVFAGNIGRFQGLDMLVEAFIELNKQGNDHVKVGGCDIELIFLGDGKMVNLLKKRVVESNVNNIHFIPHQPMPIANGIIQTADLGIVSLSPGIYHYAYPTKVIAYLSVGCPLLVMVEPESALVSFISKHNIGVNIDFNDKTALTSTIDKLNNDRKSLSVMKENASNTYKKVYGETLVLDKWSALIKNI